MQNIIQILRGLSLFLSILLFMSLGGQAQEIMLNPTTTVYKLSSNIIEYVCPEFDIDEMKMEDEYNDSIGWSPVRFAKGFDLDISTNTSGEWELVDDYHVWRYKITSQYAYSMNVLLENINIPENSSIFIYNEDMSYIVGPIQYNVNQYGVYHSEFIPGSSIIIELVIDGKTDYTVPYLTIKGVAHDYYDFFGYVFYNDGTEFAKRIDECINKDINCPIGVDWQTQKRSVALMVAKFPIWWTFDGVSRDLGYCTGALINNTQFDGKSLFLTANHCVSDNERANKTIFYFNHESNGCGNKKEHPYNFIVSGSTLRSNNEYSDFSLLELHSRIPSSYQPYFSGWDKSGTNPVKGVGIHHPAGNLKKIAIENDPITPNSTPSYYGDLGYTFAVNSLWRLNYDEGGVTGGSSGSPLFNDNKKIVGQLLGGFDGCTARKEYGRFSVSWNHGSSPATRLKEWLDPINSNPDEISGYIPEGWRNDWLTGWDQPSSHKVHPQIKSLAVGEGGQVFYRGADNKMQSYYNTSTSTWVHDWVSAHNIPNHEFIDGDVVVGEGNQLFYRGKDGKMQTYYWSNGAWHHGWLTGWNSPNHENVSAVPGSIAIGNGNQIFYRGIDNKMHTYYWTASGWKHAWISSGAPNWQNVAGDIVVGKYGGNNQVFYRGTDGKMQMYWYDFSINQWKHAWVTSGNAPSYEDVKDIPGSIAIGSDNKIFYRGIDNFVHMYYWEANEWHHAWVIDGANNNQKISGDITVNGDQVCYRGFDGKMHIYWYNHNNNQWVHDWLENSWQAPTLNNVGGAVEAGNGAIFYRANHDGLVRIYYWGGSQIITNNKDEFYAMDQVKTKPKIPMHSSALEMLVYPNPVENNLHIDIFCPQEDSYLFTLSTISGREVISQSKLLNKGFNSHKIQLNNLVKSGIYILTVQNQRTLEKTQEKIIKL